MITVSEQDGVLVVDSRLVADRLNVEHDDWVSNIIIKYQIKAEKAFGIIRFENGKTGKRGRPQKYAFLTEDQANFYMTLSRNTDEVVDCKLELVQAFSKAKDLLRQRQPKPDYIPYWYERLKVALSDTEMPLQEGYFCVYGQMMSFFCELETRLGYLVPDVNPITSEHLVPDISIGLRFNNFLRAGDEMACYARKHFLGSTEEIDFRPLRPTKKGIMPEGNCAHEIKKYMHVYPLISHGKYNRQPASSYPDKYLMLFKYFLEQHWISDFFVPYLLERDPQGLANMRNRVLQMSFSERQALSTTLIGRLVPALPMSA